MSATDPSVFRAAEPRVGDAYGEMFRRCWEADGRRNVAYEVCERDDGLVSVHDVADYFIDPTTWSDVDRWVLKQVTGATLDVGCGVGRHAMVLRDSGIEVTGIDASAGAASVCQARGMTAYQASVEDLDGRFGTFDTFLMLGNNLGLLGSRELAPEVFGKLATVARPGAILLGTSTDPHQTSNQLHLAYHERNARSGRMPGQLRQRVRYHAIATPWFDYLFLSARELSEITGATRWKIEDTMSTDGEWAARLKLT